MSTVEFPVVLFPPGLSSRPIEVERAIESDTINEHLLLEAVAIAHGYSPDPFFTTVGQYRIIEDKANDAARNKIKAEEREKAVPAFFDKLSDRYDRTKSSLDKITSPSSKPTKT